jgi:hypothetical protein
MMPIAPSFEVVMVGAVAVVPEPAEDLVDAEGATSQTEAVSTPEKMRICTDHSVLLSMFQE